jgi:pimeloyl-ACP methyl ester carboxylesterase
MAHSQNRSEDTMLRAITPARVVAIAVIAIVIAGLAYLGSSSGPAPVSVPPGGKAGQLLLHDCTYHTERGDSAADCGTLVVPENRANPRSRLIALPVVRVRARGGHPGTPIFWLSGGPGLTNMTFPQASRFTDDHDVILVGYRGVDGSSVLNCPEVTSALEHSTDYQSEASFHAYANAFRACAQRLTAGGTDLAGYSLAQQVDDLDAARVALGYGRVDLISESEGTRTAMIYAWRHPASIEKSAMIGVNPPGHFLWNPAITDEQLQHYSQLCAQDASCAKRTNDLAKSMRTTAARLPNRWLFLPIAPGDVLTASFFGLFNSMPEAFPSGPLTLDAWLSAADGDPSGMWFMALAAKVLFPASFTWGEFAAVGMADRSAADTHFGSRTQDGSILRDAGTRFAWGDGELAGAWPAAPDAAEYDTVRTSTVPTLLIGGSLDFTAPPQVATKELLPSLPNGHQVILAEMGHTADFWAYQPDAGHRLIDTFFTTGQVDDSLYRHANIDFTPAITATTLARWIVGTMIGLAVAMVASLAWVALRVRRRGGLGRVASVALRSVWPAVLGLGGWCLAALVVLAALPSVPVDDELLTTLSVGIPTGLGIYLAWMNRGRPATVGLVASLASALVGGWLGHLATTGFFALLTAVVAAATAANLTLLALDITADRAA